MDIKTLEKYLQEKIFPELETGRPGIDKPHTEGVVFHLKNIIENSPDLNLDLPVLLIAAYAHDWGYAKLFKNGQSLEMGDVANAKEEHMVRGSQQITTLLQDPFFNFLSEEQKLRASHLVEVHDKLDILKYPDELVLMEADTFGGLDTSFYKPTFNKESNDKYMQNVLEKRFPKFITTFGKKEFPSLFKMRQDFYKKQ